MSIEIERPTVPCGTCGARVVELRRGRCWGCYTRWADSRPVGRGAVCLVCNERRREMLRMVEVHNRSLPLCHGCSARAMKLTLVPMTVEGLRSVLHRDRRQTDRRDEGLDRRLYPRERRVGDRRGPPREQIDQEIEAALAPLDVFDVEIEIGDDDIEILEQTVVREAPVRPAQRP